MIGPQYTRYTSKFQEERTNSPERKAFERQVIADFMALYRNEPKAHLNVKVPRSEFSELLDRVGGLLQAYAREVANDPDRNPAVTELLREYPVPASAAEIMTPEFRVFCLALNALKQWLSAEQGAMDRVLLGGEYKKKLKDNIKTCLFTGQPLDYDTKRQVDYHHTMRDGRFPIPLSKAGHVELEGQLKTTKGVGE